MNHFRIATHLQFYWKQKKNDKNIYKFIEQNIQNEKILQINALVRIIHRIKLSIDLLEWGLAYIDFIIKSSSCFVFISGFEPTCAVEFNQYSEAAM